MKKILIVFLMCLFLIGCSNEKSNLQNEKKDYQSYVKELKKVKESTKDLPFDVEVKYDKLTKNEIRYQVIIDNVKEELDNVSAVAIHNKQTDDIFPSTGIFEKKQKLSPNKKPSGLILVGYIPYTKSVDNFKCTLKTLVRYSTANKTKTVYYVTKKTDKKDYNNTGDENES